jgi:hypothetical protein
MAYPRDISSFGQADPTDNRGLLDWKSKYSEPDARKEIRFEAIYLAVLLFGMPFVMCLLWLEIPKNWFHLSDAKYAPILKFGLAWGAGTLGGTLFAIKWLYHTVARQLWHMDRRLWRLFTPHISGGLAFGVTTLIASGVIKIFDKNATDSHPLLVGFGFLIGYFSDSAIAKLSEVADTLFGTSRSKEKHRAADVVPVPIEAEDKT